MWSLGVIIYRLMAESFPYEQNIFEIRKLDILNKNRKDLPNSFSAELRGLVDQLLQPDQSQRLTLEQLFRYPLIRAELNKIMNDFIPLTYSYSTSEKAHMVLEKVIEIQWIIARTPFYNLAVPLDKSVLRIANTEESEFLMQSELKAINDGLQFCEGINEEFNGQKYVYRGYINEKGE